MQSGASREDIAAFVKKNPHATVQQFLNNFQKGQPTTAPGGPGQAVAAEIPDVKNEPVVKAASESQSSGGLNRSSTPYNTSMTSPNSPEQEEAAMKELKGLASKFKMSPDEIVKLTSLGQLFNMGHRPEDSESIKSFFGGLMRSQKESRKRLPAYGGK